MSRERVRLDVLLVEQGYFPTRARAKAAIMAGHVFVDGQRVDKAGTAVLREASVEVRAPTNPYVSRGGLKLEWALDTFGVEPRERICLDVGASTGGFTDCLLQRGARLVYAVDVGYGQLAWRLRQDPRVRVHERTNFRHVPAGTFAGVELATVDVSFISLLKVLPALRGNLESDGDAVILIKPQFEAGRQAVSKGGGVIREPSLHRDILCRTLHEAMEQGWALMGLTYSPITGPSGNIEFFGWWRPEGEGQVAASDMDALVDAVVRKAHAAVLVNGPSTN